VTPTGSWSLAMSAFSDEREAAAIFMRWMSVELAGGYAASYASPELPASPEVKEQYFQLHVFDFHAGRHDPEILHLEAASAADPPAALESASSELETAWAQYR